MEPAVVLRQREIQQLQRGVKKLSALIDRLETSVGDKETQPKPRRLARRKAGTPEESS